MAADSMTSAWPRSDSAIRRPSSASRPMASPYVGRPPGDRWHVPTPSTRSWDTYEVVTETGRRFVVVRRMAFAAALALAPLVPSGCTSSACGDCGSGVAVWWQPGDLPESGRYELCVNGRCETVEPAAFGGAGRLLYVAPEAATAQRKVDVRLLVRDGDGVLVRDLRGSGAKSGSCCPGIEFMVGSSDVLVVKHGSD